MKSLIVGADVSKESFSAAAAVGAVGATVLTIANRFPRLRPGSPDDQLAELLDGRRRLLGGRRRPARLTADRRFQVHSGNPVVPGARPMNAMRLIKKYPNRRLYDTELSHYITLSDVRDLVMQGVELQILDSNSGEDLTRATLLQIMLEEESGGDPLFTANMLAQIIRFYGGTLQGLFARYMEEVESYPVLSRVEPGEIRGALPSHPPGGTDDFSALLADLERVIVPGITQVQHPMHFGWFPSNASLASVLGDFACAGLGTLGISWESCPALTEVEEAACDWMRQLAGLSEEWRGTIHDTASTACLTAMLAARERASDYSEFDGGLQACDRPLVVYASDQAHSSVVKAVLLAGFGHDNLRLLPSDPATRALPAGTLAQAMADDVAAGRQPAAVIASLGTTGVTAFDPVGALVEAAAAHGAWVHADAAMAGSALLLPECRPLFDGIDGADSISWNPHKWIGTILDTSLFYVRDPQTLARSWALPGTPGLEHRVGGLKLQRLAVDEHPVHVQDHGLHVSSSGAAPGESGDHAVSSRPRTRRLTVRPCTMTEKTTTM